ncbi:MAG: retroviral-like aspartic protease family protein [Gemmatimonadaceae bacterium]|jgi:predicted aspartyl protease
MTGSELDSYATPGLRRFLSVAALAAILPVTLQGCFHNAAPRPTRHANYWEALAELHPGDAMSAAHTPSETEFAEALGDLMSGNIEKAEGRFAKLRTSATDSVIRAGSRVVYTATLQYQEKWQTLSALKAESTLTDAEQHDKASIELWADAFKGAPPKLSTFRSSTGRLEMSISAVGTPLVPVKIGNKTYNFWLDTGSSLTMLSSDVAEDVGVKPLTQDTLEIVTSTGRVSARPALIPQLVLGPLVVQNVPTMIVGTSMMQMRESGPVSFNTQVKIDGIIGFDIIRELDMELDYGDGILRIRNPATSHPDGNRNLFWVGLPVILIVSNDGTPLHFGLDTGAQLTFVTETLLEKLQIEPARTENRRVGGLGGEISLRAPVLPDLKVRVRGYPILFKGAFVRAPVYQVLASLDGVLGGDVWNSGIVRIDMTNGVFAIRKSRPN